jgi:DHA2 family multidrug resistance protein-like MFS transporter
VALLALGLLVGLAFVSRQGSLLHPLIDLGLLRSTYFTAVLGANTMALFAWVGASLLVAQYLQLVIGMSPLTAGLWTVPPAIACVVGCLGAPVLSKRRSPVGLVCASLVLMAAGLAVLAIFSSEGRLTAIIAGMTLLGLGVASTVTLGTDLILTTAPPEKVGAVSAISETGAELGGAFGVAILGSIGVATYRMTVAIPIGIDPAQAASARDTLGAAADVATNLPDATAVLLLTSAQGAFTRGLEVAMGTGSALLLAMAFFFFRSALRRSPVRHEHHQGWIR